MKKICLFLILPLILSGCISTSFSKPEHQLRIFDGSVSAGNILTPAEGDGAVCTISQIGDLDDRLKITFNGERCSVRFNHGVNEGIKEWLPYIPF